MRLRVSEWASPPWSYTRNTTGDQIERVTGLSEISQVCLDNLVQFHLWLWRGPDAPRCSGQLQLPAAGEAGLLAPLTLPLLLCGGPGHCHRLGHNILQRSQLQCAPGVQGPNISFQFLQLTTSKTSEASENSFLFYHHEFDELCQLSGFEAVNVSVLSNADCVNSSVYTETMITEAMLCAGDPQGGKDSCQGDSGQIWCIPSVCH